MIIPWNYVIATLVTVLLASLASFLVAKRVLTQFETEVQPKYIKVMGMLGKRSADTKQMREAEAIISDELLATNPELTAVLEILSPEAATRLTEIFTQNPEAMFQLYEKWGPRLEKLKDMALNGEINLELIGNSALGRRTDSKRKIVRLKDMM